MCGSSRKAFSSSITGKGADEMTSGLFVASSGGHLSELIQWTERLTDVTNRVWMTPDSPQSRDLLRDEHVIVMPDVKSRDAGGVLRAASVARKSLRSLDIDFVLSTGAALACAVLPQAALLGLPTHYVESAARVDSPSVTGKLLSLTPNVTLWTQYPANAGRRWTYIGSLFQQFGVSRRPATGLPLKVVVTLGTMHHFSFHRLVSKMQQVLPPQADVTWQISSEDARLARIEGARDWIAPSELNQLMASADVVVAHAGVGSAISAMRSGAFPILVPRTSRHHEHVDNHQSQVGAQLASTGLAFCVNVESLSASLIETARLLRITRRNDPPPVLTNQVLLRSEC